MRNDNDWFTLDYALYHALYNCVGRNLRGNPGNFYILKSSVYQHGQDIRR